MTEQTDAAAVRLFPPVIPLLTIFLGIGLSKTMTYGLSGNTLTLNGTDTYDFDDDGVEEDATTVTTFLRH